MGMDYEIRVAGGPLPDELLDDVAEVEELHQPPSSVLLCHVEDQAQMQGILTRLSLLGLDIVDVRPLPDVPASGSGVAD